jgi:hypothetical protein
MSDKIGGPVSNDRSSPNLGDGQSPYDRSLRGEISEEEYDRLQAEHGERLDALQQAFEKSTVEAAEDLSREWAAERAAFYGEVEDQDPWDLAQSFNKIIKLTVADGDVLEWISDVAATYARHASIRPDGFVYVLEAGPYYKIGRTSNLTTRIKTLNIQLPFPVSCIAAFPCEEVSRSEAELHRRFDKHRVNGEWFTLPDRKPWMVGLTWLKNIRYATTEHSPYLPGVQVDFHAEVPLAVQHDEAWRKAFAAASGVVELGD